MVSVLLDWLIRRIEDVRLAGIELERPHGMTIRATHHALLYFALRLRDAFSVAYVDRLLPGNVVEV
jgi:hypothetical protein